MAVAQQAQARVHPGKKKKLPETPASEDPENGTVAGDHGEMTDAVAAAAAEQLKETAAQAGEPEAPPSGPSRWIPPQAEQAKQINAEAAQPAKVRIGLRLTPFRKVVTRGRDGSADTRYVPAEPLRHTLRARLNKVNHFFVGEWHVETQPTKWVKKTRRYEVRLNFYRRYGAFGQLEENVGAVDLAGVLDEEKDNVHVLVGVARKRLRDKFGHPYMDVVAGFAPGPVKTGPDLSKADPPAKPREAPADYDGQLLQGRF